MDNRDLILKEQQAKIEELHEHLQIALASLREMTERAIAAEGMLMTKHQDSEYDPGLVL